MKWLHQEFETSEQKQAALAEARQLTAQFLKLKAEINPHLPPRNPLHTFSSDPEKSGDMPLVEMLHSAGRFGEFIGAADSIKALNPLAKQFQDSTSSLHPTFDTFRYLAQGNETKVTQIFLDLIGERELRKKIEQQPLAPFENELKSEHERSKWHVRHLQKGVRAAGFPEFDGEKLFDEMGVGFGRVLKSRPIIVPYYATHGISRGEFDETGSPWMLGGFAGKIGDTDMDYGLGFVEQKTQDKSGQQRMVYSPLIAIDRKVLSAITDLQKPPFKKETQELANDLLSGFRSMYSLSIHDFVHQMMYSDVKAIAKDATIRTSFIPDSPPVTQDGKHLPELSYTWKPAGRITNDLVPIEKHAELLMRDTWKKIFESPNGKSVKRSVLEKGVAFLDRLEEFRQIDAKRHGESAADHTATYLAILALGRFHRIISMEDKDLSNPDMAFTCRDGTKRTFKQAAERLNITTYMPSTRDVESHIVQDPSTDDQITRRAKKTFHDSELNNPHGAFMIQQAAERLDDAFWKEFTAITKIDPSELKTPEARHTAAFIATIFSSGMIDSKLLQQFIEFTESPSPDNSNDMMRMIATSFEMSDIRYKDKQGQETPKWKMLKKLNQALAEHEKADTAHDLQKHMLKIPQEMEKIYRESADQGYAAGRLKKWLGVNDLSEQTLKEKLPDLELTGMDALHARVLFQGSHVPGWMNSYQPWQDEKYSTAEVAADFHQKWSRPEVKAERPAFTAALRENDEHRTVTRKKREEQWTGARQRHEMEPKLPPR